MNQLRNLCTNVLLNILVFIPIVYFALLASEKEATHIKIVIFIYFVCIVTILCVVVMLLINSISRDSSNLLLLPTVSGFVLIFLFFEYIIGRVKVIKSVDYSYICRYRNDEVVIYNFNPLNFHRIVVCYYDQCTTSNILHELNKFNESRIKVNNLIKFKEWDGSLDPETKRMTTIDNIIK